MVAMHKLGPYIRRQGFEPVMHKHVSVPPRVGLNQGPFLYSPWISRGALVPSPIASAPGPCYSLRDVVWITMLGIDATARAMGVTAGDRGCPTMTREAARAAIDRAKRQLARVQAALQGATDPDEVVTWAFYAYENCVVALAEYLDISRQRSHPDKVRIARLLHRQRKVTVDVGDLLERLNELRKDVAYGDVDTSLEEEDIQEIATGLAGFVEEVEDLIGR